MTESYFAEAERLVNGDRQADYGHPLDNHGATGKAWGAYLTQRLGVPVELDAEDVCMLNVLQKVIRDANSRKRDNRVDAVGYLRNVEMVEQEREQRAAPAGLPSDLVGKRVTKFAGSAEDFPEDQIPDWVNQESFELYYGPGYDFRGEDWTIAEVRDGWFRVMEFRGWAPLSAIAEVE